MWSQKYTDIYLHLYRHSTKFDKIMVNRLHGYYVMLYHCAQEKKLIVRFKANPVFYLCINRHK